MEIDTNESLTTENERVYQLRRKNFQRKLVLEIAYLGFIVIVLYYLKYGCSIWTLVLRTVVQSLLAVPFPSEIQIRRLSQAREHSNSAYFSTISGAVSTDTVEMPGAFPSTNSQENRPRSEDQIKKEISEVKTKIRNVLFHASLTVNIIFVISAILFPTNFLEKLEGNYLHEDGLTNTPSPFNNANGLIQGERKGGFFMQMIGEAIPQSNIKGNFGVVMSEFAILFCQFGLFTLTCVNFANLDGLQDEETAEQANSSSDGYDGKVHVTQIDPIGAIDIVVSSMSGLKREQQASTEEQVLEV